MFKLVVLLSCVALAFAGVARRDAPEPSVAETASRIFSQMQAQFESFGKTFQEQLNALTNSKNTKETTDALKKGSDDLLKRISDLSASLQSALQDANGKAKEEIEKARANLEKTIADLRRDHPEVEQQAAAIKGRLEAAVQKVTEDAQKVGKEIGENFEETNKKLAPQVKEAYNKFLKEAETIQKQIHDAATKQ